MNKSTNTLNKLRHSGSCLLFLALLFLPEAYAQQGIPSSGGNAASAGGSVSFSIGQVFFHAQNAANGSIVQGVQQPYEISVVTENKDAKDISLSLWVYPNPVNDLLLFKVESEKWIELSFRLYDIRGKVLKTENLIRTETPIDMSAFIPATYILKVFSKSEPVKEFKIIKN